MSMRMLIDARHREETRVAVTQGNRIEEFDFESAQKEQLKGNIYLAKVTRVEPSLQAAFIEYGGNRHGFLAFSEIHPDYYQIPKEDREALLAEEREAAEAHHAEIEAQHASEADAQGAEDDDADNGDDDHDHDHDAPMGDDDHHEEESKEGLRQKRQNLRKRYKIQEVIKRRQVLLVQVVKEERGNKGAALTTYLSLAGRYCVFMPNTNHGGGISRKISNQADRKRLKSIVSELKLPTGMGCIVRTAGLSRTKTEIKRDFDYLTRLWDEIREATLASSAPALIHEDSDLIKRAIRDIYNRDIDEVLVDGVDGHKAAKDFMKLLMPSHAKKVQLYTDPVPLFQRYQVEPQLAAMYQPVVQLKSGGYLVINPTEALVSIDINSGKSTREHNIEETAFKTNLEAAKESARQLRLRDMAGLVVIDFIDMDHHSNNRKVERALKEALKNDRARIQVGRISSFGLLEMSRQRLRTGVLEASTHVCPTCEGAGIVRTVQSAGLGAIRIIEAEALRGKNSRFVLGLPFEVAIYLLNTKRAQITEIEALYGISVEVTPNPDLHMGEYDIDASGPPPVASVDLAIPVPVVEADDEDIEDEIDDDDTESEDAAAQAEDREPRRRSRRRRRGGRGKRDGHREGHDERPAENRSDAEDDGDADASTGAEEDGTEARQDDGAPRKRRRRGRRGGRRRHGEAPREGEGHDEAQAETQQAESAEAPAQVEPAAMSTDEPVEAAPEKPKRGRRKKAEPVEAPAAENAPVAEDAPVVDATAVEPPAEDKPKRATRARKPAAKKPAKAEAKSEAPAVADEAPKPKRTRKKAEPKAKKAEEPAAPASDAESAAPVPQAANDDGSQSPSTGEAGESSGPPRRGWWQRTFGE